MRRTRAFQLVAVLLAAAILLTVTISTTQNTASTKLFGTQTTVSPASLVWEKTYGGAGDDRAYYALPVGDGFLVVGSSTSAVPNATVGWVLKLDGDGNAVWNSTFSSGSDTELRCALNVSDGFVLVGNEFSASGDVNGYVARIDNEGTLLWNRTVGGEKIDKLFSAIVAPDGFVVLGLTNSYGNETSAWAVKFNLNGDVVWNKTFGEATDIALRSGAMAVDGDYLMAGYTTLQGEDNYDFYLLKITADGTMVWNKTYGGAESEKAYSMTRATDGYVLVGDVDSLQTAMDAWVVKVDLNGNMVWNRTVGGTNADSPAYITTSKDGGYLIAGFTFSFGAGQRDFWLTKIDESGQVLWSCTHGNEGFQEAYSVMEAGANQYVMVGWTDPPGHPELIGMRHYNFYVVKVSPPQNGNVFSLQFIAYVVALSGLLGAALIVLVRLRFNSAVQKNSV